MPTSLFTPTRTRVETLPKYELVAPAGVVVWLASDCVVVELAGEAAPVPDDEVDPVVEAEAIDELDPGV